MQQLQLELTFDWIWLLQWGQFTETGVAPTLSNISGIITPSFWMLGFSISFTFILSIAGSP